MTENLLIPQRMLYQTPGDYTVTSKEEPGECACKGKEACPRHGDMKTTMEVQRGAERKRKWLKDAEKCRGADFTSTQRRTGWQRDKSGRGPRVSPTDVFAPDGIGPADLGDKLGRIQTNLDDVVEQRKRRRQWEGGHEQRHKPVLDYCGRTNKQTYLKTVQYITDGHDTFTDQWIRHDLIGLRSQNTSRMESKGKKYRNSSGQKTRWKADFPRKNSLSPLLELESM